jgi:hypothetical protein
MRLDKSWQPHSVLWEKIESDAEIVLRARSALITGCLVEFSACFDELYKRMNVRLLRYALRFATKDDAEDYC